MDLLSKIFFFSALGIVETPEEIHLTMAGKMFAIKRLCPNYSFVVEYGQFVTHHKCQREKVGKHMNCFGKDGGDITNKTLNIFCH